MASSFTSLLTRSLRIQWPRLNISPSSLIIQTRSRLYHSPSRFTSSHPHTIAKSRQSIAPLLFKAGGVAGIGLGLFQNIPRVHCDAPLQQADKNTQSPQPLPPPPTSTVSLYELSFGTVTGICAGIFIKKGAKAAAWLLGGIFVLLQYLGSASIVKVDWKRVATRFEGAFHTKDSNGVSRPPTVVSLWNWLVNFLTADFQPRASFLAGLVLGLRIG